MIDPGYEVELERFVFAPRSFASKRVLDEISLRIGPGEFVSVVGENGSGKSSLIAAIAGELESSEGETSGEVRIGGATDVDRPIHELLDGVGIVHQHDTFDLVEHMTVAENIALRQYFSGAHRGIFLVNREWTRSIRSDLASRVQAMGLWLDQPVGRLAGGQRQLLSVIIATWLQHKANPCRLLLLDEHTSRLSLQNEARVMKVTLEAIAEANCTTIMVTHNLDEALSHADSVVVLRDGRAEKIPVTPSLSVEDLKRMAFH